MADELRLKASKESYLNRIQDLDNKMQQLQAVLQDYKTLRTNVNRFMTDQDSNFAQMQENVDNNIIAVGKALGMAQAARNTLQKTVEDMDATSSNIQSILQDAASTTKNAVEAAVKIAPLLM